MGAGAPAETVPLSTERLVAHRPEPDAQSAGWPLHRRTDQREVGRLRLSGSSTSEAVEVGAQIAAGWRDRGYGAEALTAAVGYAVDVIAATRVVARVARDDGEAARAMAACGLAPTGRRAAAGCEHEVLGVDVAPIAAHRVWVREAPPEEVVGLRQRVLRPHQAPSALLGSNDRDAVDLAAVTASGQVVACARVCREAPPWTAPAGEWWRLRNMATSARARGLGIGARLVDTALQRVRAAGAERMWCSARAASVGFYARCGFDAVTDTWDDPELGPHVGMARLA